MITLNTRYHFRSRGIKKAFAFLRKLGFSHNLAHRLAQDDTKGIRFDQLEKLCIAFKCTPNDLLQWQDEGQNIDGEHPLRQLSQRPELEHIQRIKSLPLETLQKVNDLIDELDRKAE